MPDSTYTVDLLTSFLHGSPFHMRHSGYEAIVDHLKNSRVFFTHDFARLTRLSYPLKLVRLLPRSYSSVNAETAALRSDGKVLHHLYAEDTLLISTLGRFVRDRTIVATFHRPPRVLDTTMPFFWKKAIRKLSGVIALSPQQFRYLRSICGAEAQVSLIPHGIDTDYYAPSNDERSRRLLLSVGSYLRNYGTLVQAMKILHRKAPALRLISVSKGPMLRTQNLIPLPTISDEELLDYYKKACFAVLPYDELVASNAMLEAMACGMPIVCPDSESARFYLGENTPTTYEPGNPIALAEKIYWLYRNDKERRLLSSQMRERAQMFSWQKVCKLIRGFYDEVLDSKVG